MRLRNPVIAIASGILACWYVTRTDAAQVRSAFEVRNIARGSFLFLDSASNHPITVWFCRPPSITPDTRILFVMHGSESETARQACSTRRSAGSFELPTALTTLQRRWCGLHSSCCVPNHAPQRANFVRAAGTFGDVATVVFDRALGGAGVAMRIGSWVEVTR